MKGICQTSLLVILCNGLNLLYPHFIYKNISLRIGIVDYEFINTLSHLRYKIPYMLLVEKISFVLRFQSKIISV